MNPANTILAEIMTADDLDRTLNRMARQIVELLDPEANASDHLALIGMQTRGVYLAGRLQQKIQEVEKITLPLGTLDATLYRDDFRSRLKQPVIQATDIPFDVHNRRIILIDDVLYTGRSARAAMDALMDLGRPAVVKFLALVDRGLQELPIKADIIGSTVPTMSNEEIRVHLTEVDDHDGVWLVSQKPDLT